MIKLFGIMAPIERALLIASFLIGTIGIVSGLTPDSTINRLGNQFFGTEFSTVTRELKGDSL
jgi:hypothetical protein